MGLELEQGEEDGLIRITGVTGRGSATGEEVSPGDILRGLTAREVRMVYPDKQVALGGVGRPQLVRDICDITDLGSIRNGYTVRDYKSASCDDTYTFPSRLFE
jgi:hypothetical protein